MHTSMRAHLLSCLMAGGLCLLCEPERLLGWNPRPPQGHGPEVMFSVRLAQPAAQARTPGCCWPAPPLQQVWVVRCAEGESCTVALTQHTAGAPSVEAGHHRWCCFCYCCCCWWWWQYQLSHWHDLAQLSQPDSSRKLALRACGLSGRYGCTKSQARSTRAEA